MGILNFTKFQRDTYPNAFKKTWLSHYHHLYIDINVALHNCSYGALTIGDVIKKLYIWLDNVIMTCIPTKSITLCADGSAPLSKLVLQRKRRLTKSLTDNTISLHFTPATEFMNNLEKNLSQYINFIKKTYMIDVNFDVLGHDEAEIKLKRIMMKHMSECPDDTHIIATNDADVVLLLMTLQKPQQTFIYEIKHQDANIISIGKMLHEHINIYGNSSHANLDFVGVNMFMGNDYIPKLNYVSFDMIWNAYKVVIASYHKGLIINNLEIDNKFMIALMMIIVKNMKKQYKSKYTINNAFHPSYENYMDGYMWCLSTYKSGTCIRYNYMYNYKEIPHPFGIALAIQSNKNLTQISNILFPPISNVLYSILLLPYKFKNLIQKQYQNFIQLVPILYEEELCSICKNNDEKVDMKLHKKQHKMIQLNDVMLIINKFVEYELSLCNI